MSTAPPTLLVESRETLSERWVDFLTLTKPKIGVMVMLTVAAGAYVAASGAPAFWLQFHAVLGTGLVGSGASVLNQWWEHELDARMHRTANRPIPAGRVRPVEALLFGLALSVIGLLELLAWTTPMAAAWALLNLLLYVCVYTPLKQWSSLNTVIGAIPGALPPVIGAAALGDSFNPGAWCVFGIVFFWQFPHFLAIAWLCRDDYAQAGMRMLSTTDLGAKTIGLQMVSYAATLIPVSLVPAILGLVSPLYVLGALVLGLQFAIYSLRFCLTPGNSAARQVLLCSLIYLPAVLGLLVATLRSAGS